MHQKGTTTADNKGKSVSFRLPEAEYEQLMQHAAAKHVSVSDYLRSCLHDRFVDEDSTGASLNATELRLEVLIGAVRELYAIMWDTMVEPGDGAYIALSSAKYAKQFMEKFKRQRQAEYASRRTEFAEDDD